jgi:hypothetical protein
LDASSGYSITSSTPDGGPSMPSVTCRASAACLEKGRTVTVKLFLCASPSGVWPSPRRASEGSRFSGRLLGAVLSPGCVHTVLHGLSSLKSPRHGCWCAHAHWQFSPTPWPAARSITRLREFSSPWVPGPSNHGISIFAFSVTHGSTKSASLHTSLLPIRVDRPGPLPLAGSGPRRPEP